MYHVIFGKGFVGTHLAHYFRVNNIEHRIFSQEELDYTDPDVLRNFLDTNDQHIKTIINCSGYTGFPNVDGCEDNKELCYNYNVLYPLNVVRICQSFAIPVIHIGSGCIYTGYEKEYTEKDIPNFGMFSEHSSYYSKCKHVFETFAQNYRCYILRIRIPFTDVLTRKNYFTKLLNYDTLINELNSVTSLNDFNDFIVKFISTRPDYGIYNVVNPEPIKAEEVVWLLEKHGLKNPNWKFIELKDLKTKANRSNCVLSTQKLKTFGLELPNTRDSLVRDIVRLARSQGQDV
jgi:dTDP-4-dehydrorhamnose reductase